MYVLFKNNVRHIDDIPFDNSSKQIGNYLLVLFVAVVIN